MKIIEESRVHFCWFNQWIFSLMFIYLKHLWHVQLSQSLPAIKQITQRVSHNQIMHFLKAKGIRRGRYCAAQTLL